ERTFGERTFGARILGADPVPSQRGKREGTGPGISPGKIPDTGAGPCRGAGNSKEKRPPRLWFATTKAKRLYCEADFGPDDYIMFGKESAGIPEEILVDHEETCIRIPMGFGIRSLNLSNAAAIVLYEALRQNGFPGLEREGELHRLRWG
ncbi:MAG: TrmH family RNA methyltransferase, partial [Eubacteriales bacterium]|nr:TrmH family RNA methyltransferase [Eubacteriales bacterium]